MNLFRKRFFVLRLISIPFFIVLFFLLYKFYLRRVSAFGCFDDCFNYGASYFMVRGKDIYSQIFYNHQMLMAYLGFIIQKISHPQGIYNLLLVSRKNALIYGYLFDVLLILRFGIVGAVFALIYEPTKFYVFGDRFLAEGFIVYPFVYLFGLTLEKYTGKKLTVVDYLFSSVLSYFTLFMREPYSLLSLLLFTLILYTRKISRKEVVSFIIFAILCLVSIFSVSLPSFIFNVITINASTVGKDEASTNSIFGVGMLHIFFYPVYVLFQSAQTILGTILRFLSFLFIVLLGVFSYKTKSFKLALIVIILLGLSNIRYVPPGSMFYAAFHMIIWYGLLITVVAFLARELFIKNYSKKISVIAFGVIISIFLFSIVSKDAFFHDNVDRNMDFINNYGVYLSDSAFYKTLAKPGDTLFLDGWNEIMYFQSGLISSYPYSWYTSVMPKVPLYTSARNQMFLKNPPNFYYGSCKESPGISLPSSIRLEYVPIYQYNKPTCIYILKSTFDKISQSKWDEVAKDQYSTSKTH